MPPTASAPNVILIVLGAARADAFEPHGAPLGATPAIAQLMSAGAMHLNAFAPAKATGPWSRDTPRFLPVGT